MCGRFSLTTSIETICKRFDAIFQGAEWHPRYNIAPAQEILTVVSDQFGTRKIVPMLWGLIPHWSKDRKAGYKTINARAETLKEKPSFKVAFKRQRCLIPTDGYYEWKEVENRKIPLRFVLRDRSLFAMAGLWDVWHDPEKNQDITSFTIITTVANSLTEPLHDRMPAILRREHEHEWLNPKLNDPAVLQNM